MPRGASRCQFSYKISCHILYLQTPYWQHQPIRWYLEVSFLGNEWTMVNIIMRWTITSEHAIFVRWCHLVRIQKIFWIVNRWMDFYKWIRDFIFLEKILTSSENWFKIIIKKALKSRVYGRLVMIIDVLSFSLMSCHKL